MTETATVQIAMPEMGESVTEGIVLEWHVAVGDFVAEGDTVVEVSTDKVDAEIPSPAAGVLTEILAKEGDTVPVNVDAIAFWVVRDAERAALHNTPLRIEEPRAQYVIAERSTSSADDGRVLLRIYINGPRRSGYVETTATGEIRTVNVS